MRKFKNETMTVEEQEKSCVSVDLDSFTIYLDGEIGLDDGMIFEQTVKTLIETSVDEDENSVPVEEINININSIGGSVIASLNIVAQIQELQRHGIVFNATVPQYAYSGGCMIFMVCDNRYMRKFSQIMFHGANIQPPDGTVLTIADIREYEKQFKDIWKNLETIALEKTKISKKLLNRINKEALDYYMGAEEAIKLGFADYEL